MNPKTKIFVSTHLYHLQRSHGTVQPLLVQSFLSIWHTENVSSCGIVSTNFDHSEISVATKRSRHQRYWHNRSIIIFSLQKWSLQIKLWRRLRKSLTRHGTCVWKKLGKKCPRTKMIEAPPPYPLYTVLPRLKASRASVWWQVPEKKHVINRNTGKQRWGGCCKFVLYFCFLSIY